VEERSQLGSANNVNDDPIRYRQVSLLLRNPSCDEEVLERPRPRTHTGESYSTFLLSFCRVSRHSFSYEFLIFTYTGARSGRDMRRVTSKS
jgi:hypothetical protein